MLKRILLAVAVSLSSLAAVAQHVAPTPAEAAARSYANAERRVLAEGIAEYTFDVRVGSGTHDVIGVHRIVKESAPGQPVATQNAVFLAPGDIWNFRAAFLTGQHPLPVFLAENGIDVWGIDYRWTRVPGNVPDTSFMEHWGIEQDAADLGHALHVARFVRTRSGNPNGKLFLLGWSRGGQIGYAYLNAASQLPAAQRIVAGFIPVDTYLKTDVPQLKAFACAREAGTNAAIAQGGYANPVGGLVSILGTLASVDPNGASILNGPPFNLVDYTNRHAGLLVGQATFALQGGLEVAPFYHFTGGLFSADGKPAGLLYSNEADLFSFEQQASPLQPNRELADADAAVCEMNDVSFDDHLADITVPVLYIGAGGGFGEYGIYTTTLLGSTDVTSLLVSKVPSTQRIVDYGHADLFLAHDAQELVWQPMLEWLQAH